MIERSRHLMRRLALQDEILQCERTRRHVNLWPGVQEEERGHTLLGSSLSLRWHHLTSARISHLGFWRTAFSIWIMSPGGKRGR